ncbi:MAG: 23S rRNA (uridine2552-2'-O)-methyltransferase RrmJ [Oceanicaulis sp. HLUCCA04]|nr:MAG: 23S rRNA (uridine2552-2'-O)-methyltransferase RrmJ [Oceanicaulis sp. HLUCCA04]
MSSGTDDDPPAERRRRRSGPVTAGGSERADKQFHERVKTAKKRKVSSQRWLERQLNDPYVHRAKAEGYRARAAYKLIELDEKFHFLRPGMRIADLGAAPGGWVQVALKRGASHVVGIDLLEMDHIAGAILLTMDFTDPGASEAVKEALGGPADLVMSDLAPWTTGHKSTDHLRIVALVEAAADFALETLRPGGAFIAKAFQGGTESEILNRLKPRFEKVKHAKPAASRADSSETYLVALGFKG